MTDTLYRSTDTAPVVDLDVAARRVTVRLCRWNEPRDVVDPGGIRYREAYRPGSIELSDDVEVWDRHHGNLIGRGDPSTLADDGIGPTVELVLARSTAGSDTLALIEADVIRSVSMEFRPGPAEPVDGVLWRTATVDGVAFAFRPAHSAPILATRENPNPESDTTMTDTATPDAPALTPTPLPADPAEIAVTAGQLTRSLDELRDDLTRTMIAERPAVDAGAVDELRRFRSIGEYAMVAYSNPDDTVLRRALVDQITTDNPGVVPPGWIREIQGIVDFGSPLLTAFGRAPLPDTGMSIDWPYFDGDLAALVGEQATEKTPVTSVQVSIDRGSTDLATWAGASDISYQLIRRSNPEYLSAYLRIMSAAYALVTDLAGATVVEAAATASSATYDPTSQDYPDLVRALVTASVEVESATGAPAAFALAGSDMFVEVAASAAIANAVSTGHLPGANMAANLSVNVSGVPVVHDRNLSADALIVSNRSAGAWHGDGPFTVTADDVEKLGQNTAVWGMGAMVVTSATGIRTIGAV